MEIRELKKEDLPIRVQWMNHPSIYSSMHYEIPILLENTEKWYSSILTNNTRCDVTFTIDGKIVAMGGLTNINRDVNKAELYIFVDPETHHAGIGTQATKLLCDYGFSTLNLYKIYLLTNENNIPAQRVYEKCGFALEGKLRGEYISSTGKRLSRFYYGLLKEDWHE